MAGRGRGRVREPRGPGSGRGRNTDVRLGGRRVFHAGGGTGIGACILWKGRLTRWRSCTWRGSGRPSSFKCWESPHESPGHAIATTGPRSEVS